MRWFLGRWVLVHDYIDETPLLSLLGGHEEVPLQGALDVLQRPAAVLGVEPCQRLALAEDLLRVDLDVGGLPLDTLRERLVDEDLRVRKRHAFSRESSRE